MKNTRFPWMCLAAAGTIFFGSLAKLAYGGDTLQFSLWCAGAGTLAWLAYNEF